MMLRGRAHSKPGSLLKSQVPVRTWADWDDAVPGFVEIDHQENPYVTASHETATGPRTQRSITLR